MISEGSCDTEDWSNDTVKFSFASPGINYISLYIHIETVILTVIIFHNIAVLL